MSKTKWGFLEQLFKMVHDSGFCSSTNAFLENEENVRLYQETEAETFVQNLIESDNLELPSLLMAQDNPFLWLTQNLEILSPCLLTGKIEKNSELWDLFMEFREELSSAFTTRVKNHIFRHLYCYLPLGLCGFLSKECRASIVEWLDSYSPYSFENPEFFSFMKLFSEYAKDFDNFAVRPMFYADEENDMYLIENGERRISFASKEEYFFTFHPVGLTSWFNDVGAKMTLPFGDVTPFPVECHVNPMKGGALIERSFMQYCVNMPYSEDEKIPLAKTYLVYAFLPDDETILRISVTEALGDIKKGSLDSLAYECEIQDGNVLYYLDKKKASEKIQKTAETTGSYCNIHNYVGFVQKGSFTIKRDTNTLYLSLPNEFKDVKNGDILDSSSMAIAMGGIRRTRALQEDYLELDALPHRIFSASCVADNRKRYTLIFNASNNPFDWNGRIIPAKRAGLLSWNHADEKQK